MFAACAFIMLGVGAFAAYETLEAPGNQFFGKTLVAGPPTLREVALTFDDGPNPPYTDRILALLRAHGVRATFFVVGRAVLAYPATVRRMVADGDAVGNHTWDHAHLIVQSPAAIRRELRRTSAALERVAGVRTDMMRPPFGARDFAVMDQARTLGYRVVMWSVPLAGDWERPGAAAIARRVLRDVRGGSIIVLHDGNRGIVCGERTHVPFAVCDRSQDVAATRAIVDALLARGYRFVTVPQLVTDSGSGSVAARRHGRGVRPHA